MPDQDIFSYELRDIPVDQIDVGERRREDFGDVESLAADLQEFGMHSSITVLEKSHVNGLAQSTENGRDPSKPFLLQAGERRLRAAKSLKWATIPAKVNQREMDEWEISVIELHENLQRKNFTPLEEAKAKEALHDTYTKIYGKATRGPGKDGHSEKDTARILGESQANLSRDLEIARYSDAIPELKDAKTKSEARKMVKALKDKLVREEIAKREEAAKQAKPEVQDQRSKEEKRKSLLMERYVLGDFFDLIKNVGKRSIDLFELDPDWGIMFKERVRARGSLTADEYDTLQPEDYEDGLREIAKEAYRVLKDNSWLICWYSMEDWHDTTRKILEEVGFNVCPMPAFWLHTSNYTGTPAYRLGQRTESFFYCRKGNVRIAHMGHPNTFTYRTLEKDERTHPAEKPIELYEDIIKTFLGKDRKAMTCVSGFAGSGNFLLAADNLEHNALGFDSSKAFRDDYVLKVEQGTPGEYKSYK